jgi:hypothetical protein
MVNIVGEMLKGVKLHWKNVLRMLRIFLPSINGTLRKHQTTPWNVKGCQVEPRKIQGMFGNVTKTLGDVGKTLKVGRGITTM